ncbi:mannonate dehydratase [Mesorhizobium sp. L-8-10]|uniref:mannonate dehydratase n=1 Tax=unclassified Mesorhizobium TaxID=325217 RepID=UPI001926D9CB|nr:MULTISPECIES: mannonate dehydratase [unclassified Mesorhizobium]BCH21079.1 mannonate dehydratase [Mesorhizobium sp. L-8-3]BCH28922.1 mannonate dehydratase [Mesorhizobium sp. L-8-10]
MRHCWRWFGPVDKVTLSDARQAGAVGIVSALHHVPPGAVWQPAEIEKRQREVAMLPEGVPSGLRWEVVESLPVSEAIKTQARNWREHVANYRISLENLARAGLSTICYNFMPVLDWTRTDLAWRVPHGGTTMRFDLVDFAAFDLHILKRTGAAGHYRADMVEAADARFAAMDDSRRARLAASVNAGLPGSAEDNSLDGLIRRLDLYRGIDAARLRRHLIDFLAEVVPVAERLGLRLCCHPDDPPFPLLGLPRIMSTEADYTHVLREVDSPANGVTLCSGSLGARPDNDLPGMIERFGSRLHFVHLRNVTRETPDWPCSFHEAEHLSGDADMVALVAALLNEEARRRAHGRADWEIPMRPDHGQDILDDLKRGAQPGYPAIGRLKGLAELRGVECAVAAIGTR